MESSVTKRGSSANSSSPISLQNSGQYLVGCSMDNWMNRPSLVRYAPVNGFPGAWVLRSALGSGPPNSIAMFTLNWVAHAPTASSETSTTQGFPVVALWYSAAATPPAIDMPPTLSP